MKKIITMLLCVLAVAMSTAAQNADQQAEIDKVMAELEAYIVCFHKNFSHGPRHEALAVGGRQVSAATELHFDTGNFHIADNGELASINYLTSTNSDNRSFSIADYHSITNVFSMGDLDELQQRYYNRPNTFHLLGHGIVDHGEQSAKTICIDNTEVGPRDMAANMVAMLQGYHNFKEALDQPLTVVVHSCRAGLGDDGFAAQLSRELAQTSMNFYVVAAPADIYPTLDKEKGYLVEKVAASADDATNDAVDGLNWKIFHNGATIADGYPSFDDTVTLVERSFTPQ